MAKKTICLLSDWYPTKDNKYKGLYFKEQAFAVSDYFDFVIVHYSEYRKKKLNSIRYTIEKIGEENNTIEYRVNAYLPNFLFLLDYWNDFIIKNVKKQMVVGVGFYEADKKIAFRKKILEDVFLKELAELKIDCMYCVDAQNEAGNIGIVANALKIPYIIGEHAPVPWPGFVLNNFNKIAIEKADAFLAISFDKIRQLSLLNIKLSKTKYIGNLVDEDVFKIHEKREKSAKNLLIVAANSFYKNYDMFFEVMDRLNRIASVPYKIMIVGYGANRGYSKDVELFEEKVRKLEYADKIELIPEVAHEDIGEIYDRADAFIMTSIQEGQPVSAIEAACCGIPIFSTKCGGVEDYVDEKMGRIFNLTESEKMAVELKRFIEGDLTFDSCYIRETIVSLFGKEAFVKNFTDIFNGVIENNK